MPYIKPKLKIPEGFKFFDQKMIQYPENKIKIKFSKN